jgi:long-chain acyl-CoA synthetase
MMSDASHPWLDAYPENIDWAMRLPSKPLFQFLDDTVARFPHRPAIDFLGRKYTYRELGHLVDRAARGFKDMGVEKGVQVGLCLPNTPYFVVCFFAVLKAGGTVVNYNPLYAERELAHQVSDSQTKIMVTLDLHIIHSKVAALLEKGALEKVVICQMAKALPLAKGLLFSLFKRGEIATRLSGGRYFAFEDLVADAGDITPSLIDPEGDIAVLQYTGGTTGVPKGAMLTHANLSANAAQVMAWFQGIEEGQERVLGVIPLFHVFAMAVVMNMAVAAGAEMILLPRFELDQVLKTINKARPTLLPGVPTIYTAINNHPDLSRFDLSSIKFCISGGAPLPQDVKQSFETLSGCRLVEGYGLTETSPVATCNPILDSGKEAGQKDGSIGIPLPATEVAIRSLEDQTKILAPGERGEVWIKGPQVMAGYWNCPDETAQVMDGDWLRTGDVGYMDDDGYIFLVDRIKDLILCSGFNVYPRVIEEAIHLHPSVAEVTVIGIDDEYRGQSAKAFIVLKAGMALETGEVTAFLSDKLSPIEMPKEIEFRKELPKTMIGKLSKKELVEEEQTRKT